MTKPKAEQPAGTPPENKPAVPPPPAQNGAPTQNAAPASASNSAVAGVPLPANGAQPGTDVPGGPASWDGFLRMAVGQGVSDIHLHVGMPPMLRKDGRILPTKLPAVSMQDFQVLSKLLLPPSMDPSKKTDIDCSTEIPDVARFRVNFFYELGKPGFVLRVIPHRIPGFEELGIPPVLKKFTELVQGLVLVTGPTGSGKSTTLASILNHINGLQTKHIVTLEDPVEFVYKNNKSLFTQRQVGIDVPTFPEGVKYALRQDVDVLLVGELRDRDTIMSALTAAETGHLVFGTLHTSNAIETINRIINAFSPHEREHVRGQLSVALQGVVSQRLVRRSEGRGRYMAAELLFVTPSIKDYIQRNEMDEIYMMLEKSQYEGIVSLNHSLCQGVFNHIITAEDALEITDRPDDLQKLLRGAFHGAS